MNSHDLKTIQEAYHKVPSSERLAEKYFTKFAITVLALMALYGIFQLLRPAFTVVPKEIQKDVAYRVEG